MYNFTKSLYEKHHLANRRPNFSILKDERGSIFASIIGKKNKILDIGCRDGALTKYFLPDNNVVGVDVDSIALSRARELGVDTVEMDIYSDWSILNQETFDVVVAGEVLEHLFHPGDILKKIHSKLVSGGVFIGSVPNAFSLKNRLRYLMGSKINTPLADPTHINQFSYCDLKDMLFSEFGNVTIIGLGRYKKLAKYFPNLFAFDFVFICRLK